MINHYLKIVFRDINKNKLRYLLTTLGIAVGIAIFALMHFVVDFPILLTSLPNDKDLYEMVSSVDRPNTYSAIPLEALDHFQAESINDIEQFAVYSGYFSGNYTVNSENENAVFKTTQRYVSQQFFSIISVEFIHGNANSWGNRKQAVITDKMAEKLFGDEYPLGKQIHTQTSAGEIIGTYTITGVIKSVSSENYYTDIYLEWNAPENKERQTIQAIVKLKKGTSPIEANKALKNMTLNKGFESFWGYNDQGDNYLKLIGINENKDPIPTSVRITILILAAIVLTIALFNFFNMLITSVQSRIRQFTLRKVVGANHLTILAMLLSEIVLILLFALLLSYSFIELIVTWLGNLFLISAQFNNIGSYVLSKIYRYPLIIAGWTLLISILAAILLSYRIQKMVLVQGIRGKVIKSRRNVMRNVLIFLQLLFTLIFLSTAIGFSIAGLDALSDVHKTLSKEQSKAIFELNIADVYNLTDKSKELKSRIKQIPGADLVVSGDGFLGSDIIDYDPRFPGSALIYTQELVEGYQELFELDTPLPYTSLAPDEVIINEKLANYLIQQEGKETFESGTHRKTYKIVGTVPQIPYTKTDSYAVLLPDGIKNNSAIIVKSTPANAQSVHKQLMLLIREYVPETIPFEIPSLYEKVRQHRVLVDSTVTALLIATLMSLLLTIFGVFTAVNADTKLRRKEIAIRKINGATYRDVLWKYLKLYTITLIAVLITSIPLYLITVKLLEVPFTNRLGVLLISWIFIVAFVLLTVFKQIQQTASENPADVLKSE